jgi:hypothetical protein
MKKIKNRSEYGAKYILGKELTGYDSNVIKE